MTTPNSKGLLSVAGVCIILAVMAWGWQNTALRAKPIDIHPESWEHVKQQYPLPEERSPIQGPAVEPLDEMLHANPFSPERKPLQPVVAATGAPNAGALLAAAAPKAAFIYKGRVTMGQQQRAIMEDTTTKKTFFLQVGQEVAGFKVLDITQKQVLLSDPNTHEEVVVSLASSER